MQISILGYRVELEIIILIVVLYLVKPRGLLWRQHQLWPKRSLFCRGLQQGRHKEMGPT
jgi:hypothetical protein